MKSNVKRALKIAERLIALAEEVEDAKELDYLAECYQAVTRLVALSHTKK